MNAGTETPVFLDGHLTPPSTPVRITPRPDMDDESSQDRHFSPSPSPPPSSTLPERIDLQADGHPCPPLSDETKRGQRLTRPIVNFLRSWNPTLVLENSGSVARDHLASERTFLAYMRTSLTIASTGVALVQLFTLSAETSSKTLEKYSRPLGAVIIIIGLGVLLLGLVRYFLIQNALMGGNYPIARVSIFLISVVMSAITIVVFGIIVGVR
ncbi:hypothetical protein BDY19DRAFT_174293 [Irpex rosettiformis]|uniref:Uncharacterized protein n=1 Tax=Irpex rosettiformis TaxID=378272 RepID=A0ACB8U2W5_9APHY|nr:hypothetical protein BDY19DRAFT_174293 [Irpex rosettiformis]